MNKQQATESVNELIKDFVDTCPHCEARVHLKMLFVDSYWEQKDLIFYITFRCVPCKGLVVKTLRFKQDPYSTQEELQRPDWENKFPQEGYQSVKSFSNSVPVEVYEGFEEGVNCLLAGCLKASVTMFRRSLQSALLNLGANPEDEMLGQIKNMDALTKDIKDWAHNIRIFGNWGAHPQTDNLKDVDQKIAEETQSFLEQFFNYVYVMPKRVADARPKKSYRTNGIII